MGDTPDFAGTSPAKCPPIRIFPKLLNKASALRCITPTQYLGKVAALPTEVLVVPYRGIGRALPRYWSRPTEVLIVAYRGIGGGLASVRCPQPIVLVTGQLGLLGRRGQILGASAKCPPIRVFQQSHSRPWLQYTIAHRRPRSRCAHPIVNFILTGRIGHSDRSQFSAARAV